MVAFRHPRTTQWHAHGRDGRREGEHTFGTVPGSSLTRRFFSGWFPRRYGMGGLVREEKPKTRSIVDPTLIHHPKFPGDEKRTIETVTIASQPNHKLEFFLTAIEGLVCKLRG